WHRTRQESIGSLGHELWPFEVFFFVHLGLAWIEGGVDRAYDQRAVSHGRRHALGRAPADVSDGKDAAARALQHERASVRSVPVSGKSGVAARLLAGDDETLVVLADVIDQSLRPRRGADHREHGRGFDAAIWASARDHD